jgi:pimeloyl-ACP methyl ester carboxylesterase
MDAATKSFRTFDDLEIAYQEWGEPAWPGPPVFLHHGFVVDASTNWVAPGVVAALVASGRRVIAPDARGHGRSSKPHDPGRYGEERMARDLALLVRETGQGEIDLVGYSMGAVVSLLYASSAQGVRRLVVGGVGSGVVECGGVDRRTISNESIIEALQAEDPSAVAGSAASWFRALADALGADRGALAAQARAVHRGGVDLQAITARTLVLAGDQDPLADRPEVLAGAIPGAELRYVAGDHAGALADPLFRSSIVDFLT